MLCVPSRPAAAVASLLHLAGHRALPGKRETIRCGLPSGRAGQLARPSRSCSTQRAEKTCAKPHPGHSQAPDVAGRESHGNATSTLRQSLSCPGGRQPASRRGVVQRVTANVPHPRQDEAWQLDEVPGGGQERREACKTRKTRKAHKTHARHTQDTDDRGRRDGRWMMRRHPALLAHLLRWVSVQLVLPCPRLSSWPRSSWQHRDGVSDGCWTRRLLVTHVGDRVCVSLWERIANPEKARHDKRTWAFCLVVPSVMPFARPSAPSLAAHPFRLLPLFGSFWLVLACDPGSSTT